MMKETQNKPEQDRKAEKAVLSGRQKLLIRAPWTIRIIGVIGMVFGGLMSFWCYRDYLNGNETASVGMSLGFLLIFGTMGLWLWCYGCRMLQVKGEEILFRDIFFRKHRYTLDDICSVRWNHDGFVFQAVPVSCLKFTTTARIVSGCLNCWRNGEHRWTFRGECSARSKLRRLIRILINAVSWSGLPRGFQKKCQRLR